MKFKAFFVMPSLALLAACGGSSVSENGGFANSATIRKSYSDNSGVAVATAVPGGTLGSFNAVLIVDNINKADAHLDALYLINNGQGTLLDAAQQGDYYQQSVYSNNKYGEEILLIYAGQELDSGGYVSTGISVVGESAAITTDGSRLVSTPIGNYQYTGVSSVVATDLYTGVEDGTFIMSADFNSNRASVFGQTSSKVFSSDDLRINSVSGQFYGDGTIGNKNGASNSASFAGFFAGVQAEGVHGTAYTKSNFGERQFAVFYGSR